MIQAKVADLIDDRTLVLNKGSKSKVKIGMRFMLFDANGKKIIDPDSKKELGKLKIPKVAVEVKEVYAYYCVAETYKYKTVNTGGRNSALMSLGYLQAPKYVRKYETFSIEDSTKKAINEHKSIVKIGDIAEELQVEQSTEEE